ncbi:unnamed protein product [Alopecurus aequalis]
MPLPAVTRRRTQRGRARKSPAFHVSVFRCMPEPWEPWERDWADLPADVMSCVLHKLDIVELLLGGVAGVCVPGAAPRGRSPSYAGRLTAERGAVRDLPQRAHRGRPLPVPRQADSRCRREKNCLDNAPHRDRDGSAGGDSSAYPKGERDWADLPADAISCVLHKLSLQELLLGGVAEVCRSWRRAAREEPELWRRIDVRYLPDIPSFTWRATRYNMMRVALGLSEGQCHTFLSEDLDDDLFLFLAQRAPSLKSLHLTGSYRIMFSGGFADTVKKLPLLEDLTLVNCYEDAQVLELVAKACPCLKHFSLVHKAKCARIFMDCYEYVPPSSPCSCCSSPMSYFSDFDYDYDYDDYHDLSLYSYLGDDIDGADFEEHERILDIKRMRRYLS